MNDIPCNEKDFALPAVVLSGEVKISNPISAIILRKLSCEVLVACTRNPCFLQSDLLQFLINLKDNVPVCLFPLEFHKLLFAVIAYRHP